jgi:glycosyltransferase involved in cell wall biosynthesis
MGEMKLVIQIPCLNEEATLPLVLKSIPKKIAGIDEIIVLVINDGSSDRTVEVAKQHGVKEFVHHAHTMGLAHQFQDGINRALELGADIVVNTDGDNQYPQSEIGRLVAPILAGKADIVVSDRQTDKISHFSPLKKLLQKIGSQVVNWAAGTKLPDAASGFRAYSRESLLRLNIITKFSYAMETIIQAGNKNMAIVSIPVITNAKTRESRLFKSQWEHVRKSALAITRAYIMYKPYVVFTVLGILFLVGGLIPFVRYLYFYLHHSHRAHLQSLILGTVMLTGSFLSFVLVIVSDLIRTNRILQEQALEHIKAQRFERSKDR